MAPPGFQDVGYHLCISEEFYIYRKKDSRKEKLE
jgi:hypothetical protein